MHKQLLITLLLFFSAITPFIAQDNGASSCETVEKTDEQMALLPWYDNNDFLDQFSLSDSAAFVLKGRARLQERSGNSCPDIENMYMIPVRFWIYRDTDNDPAMPTDEQLQTMMDRLNFLYQSNGMNVRFFMLCPQYITNPNMVSASDWNTFWNVFGGGNTDPNAINVHIVGDYEGGGGVYNSLTDIIVVERSVYTTLSGVSTLAHEIGHYFGLEHTHRNWDTGRCRQECVSRTREFNFWDFCFKSGKICGKNGDALCDTPADPDLSRSDMMSGCTYSGTVTDNYGATYSPDVANIMSYAPRSCRTNFSIGQINVMAYNLLINRSKFQTIDANETDPDQYEPDNSDVPGVPRPIALGASQCHSFYDMIECQDPVDWLIMGLNQGVIGFYQIKIDDVDNAANPVETVRVWNIGGDGMRSTEVVTNETSMGSTRIFEFPCSSPNNNSLLIEVVRKSNVTEGKYVITLSSSMPLSISGTEILCQSGAYTINGLPNGATVSWTSSSSIVLHNTSGPSAGVQSFTPGMPTYWIEATVNWGGCSQVVRKTFTYAGSNGIPNFFIVTDYPACFPGGGEFSISNPGNGITYTWSCDGIPCNGIVSYANGVYASVGADAIGTMTITATGSDGCGGVGEVDLTIHVPKCGFHMSNIMVSPNPTTGLINVGVEDTYDTEGTYHVMVVSQMSELKYQADYSSKNFSINLQELENGIYRILVYRDTTSASATFIVNK